MKEGFLLLERQLHVEQGHEHVAPEERDLVHVESQFAVGIEGVEHRPQLARRTGKKNKQKEEEETEMEEEEERVKRGRDNANSKVESN